MRIKSTLSKISRGLVAVSIFVASRPPMVHAQQHEWTGTCVGTQDGADVATIQGLECLVANIFTVFITVIGLAAFVMFIVGSLTWLVAGTNSSNLDKAKKSFTYAVVGIAIALSAFIILNLIASFTGVNIIRNFVIPTSDRGLSP